jgi:hypothetical protein
MNKLEEELLNQRKELLERQNIAPNGRISFETLLGDACIRVNMKISNNVFIDKGYSPGNFGYSSYDIMETEIIRFLKKGVRLKYQRPFMISFRKLLDKFDDKSFSY